PPRPTSCAPRLSPGDDGPGEPAAAGLPEAPCYALRNVDAQDTGALHRALGGARFPDPGRLPVARRGLAAARRGRAHGVRQGPVLPPPPYPPPLRPAGEGRRQPLSPRLRDA